MKSPDAGWTRIAYIGLTSEGPAQVHWDSGWKDSEDRPARFLKIIKLGTILIWRTG